jgi:hypothetical protein
MMGSEHIMNTKPVVNMRAVILSYALLLATPLFARQSTDVIVMKNGDHLTGEIKGLNAGVLYVSMEYILGTSSLQWSKVARLESKQLFLVKTEDGSVYAGTLNTADTPGGRPVKIEVAETSGKETVIDSSRIVQMDMTSAKFFQRFNGSLNTGIIYSKGNQSAQYSLGSQITYPRERWAAGASFSSTLSTRPALLPPPETNWISMPSVSCAGTTGSTRALALSCKAPSRGFSVKPPLAVASDVT